MSETKQTRAPWGWQKISGDWYLVGQHGRRPVVLSISRGKFTSTVDGILGDFDPEHPDAVLMATSAGLLFASKQMLDAVKAGAGLHPESPEVVALEAVIMTLKPDAAGEAQTEADR